MLHASDILQKGLKTVGITVYLIFIALRYSVYKMQYYPYANLNKKNNGKKTFENPIVANRGQDVLSSPISGPFLETMWRTVPPFSLFFVFHFMTEELNCFAYVLYDMYQQAMTTRTGIQTLMHCSSDLWSHRKRFSITDELKKNIDLRYNNQLGVRFIYKNFNTNNKNQNVLHIIERKQKFLNIYLK